MLLQAIVCRLPYSVLCLLATLQVWQVRTSRTPAITHSIVTVTAKYTPKAKPPSSAQLLLYAVGRNCAKYRLHQPAFQGCPAKSSSLSQPPSNHFRNPTQHTCMAARLLPSHLFSARRSLPYTHTMLQRPSSTKTYHNVTRPTIQASC
jgi:hypothetical protein